MILGNIFELNLEEQEMIEIAKEDKTNSNYCLKGKNQEKGIVTEQLAVDLLKLFDNVEVLSSERGTALDERLKVDIVLRCKDDPYDVFAFQVKSSELGAKEHFNKYGESIVYKGHYFRTPWCLIIDGKSSNETLFSLLAEELCLACTLDFKKLDKIKSDINNSVNKRVTSKPYSLNKKHIKALRLLYNINSNGKTFFIK